MSGRVRAVIGISAIGMFLCARSAFANFACAALGFSATEGSLFSGTVGSTIDSDTAEPASNFTATIAWGDGTTTPGTVTGSSGTFAISGSHTYADEGMFTYIVSVSDVADGLLCSDSDSASVGEGDALTGTPVAFTAAAGHLFSGTVATFSDTDTSNVASDFTATIEWGDGTTTAGTVSGGTGAFAVSGAHTYASAGAEALSITLSDDAPGTATATVASSATVVPAGFHVTALSFSASEGSSFSGMVATFTDSDLAQTVSNFTATIDWGDGTTTAGTVSGSSGSFAVSGSHTYADEGTFTDKVTAHDILDSLVASPTATATVTEGDALSGTGVSFSAVAATPFSGTIANFTDTNVTNPAADFTATIEWGDGTTTAGTVSGGTGAFAVSGAHTYASAGPETLSVTLSDDAPGTATATATSHATVQQSGASIPTLGWPGLLAFFLAVALAAPVLLRRVG